IKKHKNKSTVPKSKVVSIDSISDKEDELNVEDYVLEREYLKTMLKHLDNLLSIDERKVFKLYAHGYSYNEIAEEINSTPKTVDNILQKIKRKLRR
ncbi:MAG: sigma-70 family RNA polymerase sigma factor, partial [Ruminococcus sp.]|nr:sigma-70 family RNA polymerase sigma factor [Ruminococcus sp.]